MNWIDGRLKPQNAKTKVLYWHASPNIRKPIAALNIATTTVECSLDSTSPNPKSLDPGAPYFVPMEVN